MKTAIPVLIRLMRKIRFRPSSCWEWQGVVGRNGYGLIGVGSMKDGTRTMTSVHRVSYEGHKGEIPTGLYVLHKCDNKICVNPAHLFLGTQKDNINDAVKKGRHHWASMTHCKNGHEYSPKNTGRKDRSGGRACLTCRKARKKKAQH